MNHGTKNKLLTWLVVLLLIANAATIAIFWLGKAKHPPKPGGTPQEFLVRELRFDSSQQKQFEVLRKEHQDAAGELREKIKTAKESFFDLLKQGNPADSAKQAAARNVSTFTEELDVLTFNHFQKLRALCTPEQQKKFDSIIHQVTSMIGQPRPPGDPGNGPPGADRPPPPGGPGGDRPPPPEN